MGSLVVFIQQYTPTILAGHCIGADNLRVQPYISAALGMKFLLQGSAFRLQGSGFWGFRV